jgi:hypothetical protein
MLQSSGRSLQLRELEEGEALQVESGAAGPRLADRLLAHAHLLQRISRLTVQEGLLHLDRLIHALFLRRRTLVGQDVPGLVRTVAIEAVDWAVLADTFGQFSSIGLQFQSSHLADEPRPPHPRLPAIIVFNIEYVLLFLPLRLLLPHLHYSYLIKYLLY